MSTIPDDGVSLPLLDRFVICEQYRVVGLWELARGQDATDCPRTHLQRPVVDQQVIHQQLKVDNTLTVAL